MTEEEVRESIQKTKDMLAVRRDKKGEIIGFAKTLDNVRIILNNDIRFADILCYNEIDMKVYKAAPFPWEEKKEKKPWEIDNKELEPLDEEYDVLQMERIIQRDYGQNIKDVREQFLGNAMENSFNPVKILLEGLEWDGKEHIRYLMPKYLGVENDEYQYKVLRLMMLTLLERQWNPSKMDGYMVLGGQQGLGKSSFCRTLAEALGGEQYFTDSIGDVTDKDTLQIVAGKLVIEMAENLSKKKTKEVEAMKRFFSGTFDTFRPPYQSSFQDFPRRCIVICTTNEEEYLDDVTGNRRAYTLECRAEYVKDKMAIQHALPEFVQAWAEAFHDWKELRKNGKVDLVKMSYELAPEAAKHAVSHEEENPYEGEIGQYLQMKINKYFSDMSQQPRVCCKEIAQCALGIQNPGRFEIKDIAKILDNKFPDWERKGKLQCGMYGVQRVWVPKDEILKQEKKEEEKKVEPEPKKEEEPIPEPQEQYKIVDSDIML